MPLEHRTQQVAYHCNRPTVANHHHRLIGASNTHVPHWERLHHLKLSSRELRELGVNQIRLGFKLRKVHQIRGANGKPQPTVLQQTVHFLLLLAEATLVTVRSVLFLPQSFVVIANNTMHSQWLANSRGCGWLVGVEGMFVQ